MSDVPGTRRALPKEMECVWSVAERLHNATNDVRDDPEVPMDAYVTGLTIMIGWMAATQPDPFAAIETFVDALRHNARHIIRSVEQ